MVPLALMRVAWKERNKRAFEEVESSFLNLGVVSDPLFSFGGPIAFPIV